jgi:hypothetical protein
VEVKLRGKDAQNNRRFRVGKPAFKDTLARMIKKKPPEPPKESKI